MERTETIPGAVPRLVIAGTAGDSGKTLVTLGLLSALRARGLRPGCFKKGPDYIDAAWLSWAAGSACRNLDTFMQPAEGLLACFGRHASAEINIIEGNRGLLDGMDLEGTHSTASLARLLKAPVVLVVGATKVTRTVAAVVLGCKTLEPGLNLAGVILNRVAGPRHRRLVCRAVEELAGVPVLGALPRMTDDFLPGRHLGLVPPQEHPGAQEAARRLGEVVEQNLDLGRLVQLARGDAEQDPRDGGSTARAGGAKIPAVQGDSVGSDGSKKPLNTSSYGAILEARPLDFASGSPGWPEAATGPDGGAGARVTIGVFWDSAFTFYYPDNLEALVQAGARLVQVSGLVDEALPRGLDALYLGGGFPETHAHGLAENRVLKRDLRQRAEDGMPIYAECGGLIYLCRRLRMGRQRHDMAGVLPLELELMSRPAGHGYVRLRVDHENPFFDPGQELTGHEFHYTRVVESSEKSGVDTAFEVLRGKGCFDARDGVTRGNVLAAYTHLHAVGTPGWAPGLVRRAERWRRGSTP